MPIRMTIIDGHTLVRYGLRELLSEQSDLEILAECASAADAARQVGLEPPDVVILDSSLPDGDGLVLARELRARHPGLGIVILASQGEDATLFRAIDAGASAFVAKTAPVDEVLAAVRHAAVAPASFSASGLGAALARRHRANERLALSGREAEVLRMLRDGMSVPAISATMFISQSTAKTYVARLYDKLGAANRAQALMAAVRHGLIGHSDDGSSHVTFLPVPPARDEDAPPVAQAS
jgi:DNA-binding NarL/FixJ family response regulator